MFALPQDLLLTATIETGGGVVTPRYTQTLQLGAVGGGYATVSPHACADEGKGLSLGVGHNKGAIDAQFAKRAGPID